MQNQRLEFILDSEGHRTTKASKGPSVMALQRSAANGGKPLVGYDFDDTLYPLYKPWTERINTVWRNDQADRVRTQLEANPTLMAESGLSEKARTYMAEYGYLPATKTPSSGFDVPSWPPSKEESEANDPIRKEIDTFLHQKDILPKEEKVAYPVGMYPAFASINEPPVGFPMQNFLKWAYPSLIPSRLYHENLKPLAGDKMIESFIDVVKAGGEPVIVTAHPYSGRYAADMSPEETLKWKQETHQSPNEDFEKAKMAVLSATLEDYQDRHPEVKLPREVRDLPNRFIFTHDKQDQGLAVLFDDSLGNVARMQDRTPPAQTKVVVINSPWNTPEVVQNENQKRAGQGKAPLNVEYRTDDVAQGMRQAREIIARARHSSPAGGQGLVGMQFESTPTSAPQLVVGMRQDKW